MSLYTGRTKDGSDAIEAGVYLSPDGEEWSSHPYTKEQKEHAKIVRTHWEVWDWLANNSKTLRQLYTMILNKEPTGLSARQKNYVKNCFTEDKTPNNE